MAHGDATSAATARASAILAHLRGGDSDALASSGVTMLLEKDGVAVVSQWRRAMGPDELRALDSAVEAALAAPSVAAVVIAGAAAPLDVALLASAQRDARAAALVDEALAAGASLVARLRRAAKPVVAAVAVPVTDSSLGILLACSARVAAHSASVSLAEARRGLAPVFGALPALAARCGAALAVDVFARGRVLRAEEACKRGLYDSVEPHEALALSAAVAKAAALARGERPAAAATSGELAAELAAASKALAADPKLRGAQHVRLGLELLAEQLPPAALRPEREAALFTQLLREPACEARLHLQLATQHAQTLPGLPQTSAAPLRRVAVLGGGTMGSGIAAVLLLAGAEVVVLKEVNERLLADGVKRVSGVVTRQLEREGRDARAVLARLRGQTTYEGFGELELVVEAALESVALKQRIFSELEAVCSAQCVLATNTSTIDIAVIAQPTRAQTRLVGLHFFSPAHVMPLLEIVRTPLTDGSVLAACLQLAQRIRKVPVVTANCVGFCANRVFFPYTQAATLLVDHGVHPYRVDRALVRFGMPMGVFQMGDLSGLDIHSHVGAMIRGAYGERCYESSLLAALVEQKRLGQKTGAGVYRYEAGKTLPDEPGVAEALARARADAARASSAPLLDLDALLSDEDIVHVCLLPVANEAARVVAEGVVRQAGDVDVASVLGYGFPEARGGVMHWAGRAVGWSTTYQRLAEFAGRFGAANAAVRAFFEPSDALRLLAATQ